MNDTPALAPPPMSLYVHVPWCVRKCPYCDFNSHAREGELPEQAYIGALQRDLDAELPLLQGRRLRSVFIGGGTPSLFHAESIAALLNALHERDILETDAEITLEANPGTAEAGRFRGFREAGVNRLSIGVQSFDDERLRGIGRIHDGDDARRAIELAVSAGFDDFNIDLMYGLPDQSPAEVVADIETALRYRPPHLSWYQLTIEPNTVFYRHTPLLPEPEATDDAWRTGSEMLEQAGLRRYEISAWAQPGHECDHNRNYWQFGDYLGIGAGAHGKITTGETILRTRKPRQPDHYLAARFPDARIEQPVPPAERPQEFLMNQLRLFEPFDPAVFQARTGLPASLLSPFVERARQRGLLCADRLQPTGTGYQFLDDLLTLV